MTVLDAPAAELAGVAFSTWVARFGTALDSGDAGQVADCLTEDGYWRDILAFTWEYRTFHGKARVAQAMAATLPAAEPCSARVAPDRFPPRLVKRSARAVVEGYFDFDTKAGRGTGFARLLYDAADPSESRAWLLLTTLQELRGFEEKTGPRRPTGIEYATNFRGANWLDSRAKAQHYADRNPDVLIIGGGQSGLCLAARLGQVGVDALIVEKNPRIGDNWRHRYHSLTLHNEVWANSLPYLEFPPTWPAFLPKDKLAGWLEAYAEFMELNVWTGTEFCGGHYDEATREWAVQLTRPDGRVRELRVPHVVLATGSVSGVPHLPALPGLPDFAGEVIHSSQFTSGSAYQGRQAIVVGTGNSGHDVAQDLHANGAASVTMVQRHPTCVVSLVPSGTMVYALYSEGPPVDDVDLITAAIPYPVLRETYQWLTKRTCSLDNDLLEGLRAAGFETDFESDGTGFHMRYLRRGGGYYINVGCSDLIANGRIKVLQARDTTHFTARGLGLTDGTTLEADLVVLATGYENQQDTIRRQFGNEVADRIGPIWGFNEDGFMRNMWTRSAQPGIWIMGGALNEARLFSRFLALLLRAELAGRLPPPERLPLAVTPAVRAA
ncbi:MAG: FAD-dependent oxidoreductase [Nocardiopsaceae bacterium]|jgi:cation diffusion facilitator CzcD-associated flavoprotein CzcO|nr:FAD-dependent oxidoreductase [Nocardiopsaceae bacterium]